MAGSPVRRAKKAVADAARALTEGREDDARRALADLKRCLDEAGIEAPAMPQEVTELWLSISEPRPARKAYLDGTALMTDRARGQVLQAGELAAGRLLEVLADDRLFGYAGAMTLAEQKDWLTLALSRGFGTMAAGAQRVQLPEDGAPGQVEVGKTLRLLVRAKQQAGQGDGELVEGEGFEALGEGLQP